MRSDNRLLGTWRLTRSRLKFSDTGEETDLMGPSPDGFLAFLEGNRMMAIITDSERKTGDSAGRLLTGMLAYSGRYTLEGNRFTTDVDVSWHPSWLGSKQIRYFEIDGDELRITSAEQTRPAFPDRKARAMLVWRRES